MLQFNFCILPQHREISQQCFLAAQELAYCFFLFVHWNYEVNMWKHRNTSEQENTHYVLKNLPKYIDS